MKSLVLFEDEGYAGFLPLTNWRTVFELRVGRFLQIDRIARRLGGPIHGVWTREWIARVAAQRCGVPVNAPVAAGTVLVNGRWFVHDEQKFATKPCVGTVGEEVAYVVCDKALAERLTASDFLSADRRAAALRDVPTKPASGTMLRYPWDITSVLSDLLKEDWHPTEAAIESALDSRVVTVDTDAIHIGARTDIHPTVSIDAAKGPIYISHDVRVGAYAALEGPLYLGPGCTVNPQAWLHGGNAIGPVCKVGGEIHGCVVDGFSNKQHHGFLGHAYVGSWVNIGAGCCNSDLKNTYGTVRAAINGAEVDTGVQFFGAVIGDHAKIGINASIPTGAVMGTAASVSGGRMIPKFVPSFAWMTGDGISSGDPRKLLDTARVAMARRNVDITDAEAELFLGLREITARYEPQP